MAIKLPLVRRSSYEREKAQIEAARAAERAALQSQLDLANANTIGLTADRDRLAAHRAHLTANAEKLVQERDEAVSKNASLTLNRDQAINESNHWQGQVTAYRAECERLGNQVLQLSGAGNAKVEDSEFERLISEMRHSGARSRLLNSLYCHPTLHTPDQKALFVLHKTASMFVWRLISVVSEIINLPLHSPNGEGAEYILDEISIAAKPDQLANAAGLIGPFRGYVNCDLDAFSRIVVVFRDPRDLLVSMYYSWSRSHAIDEERLSLVGPDGKLFNPTDDLRKKWIDEGPDPFALEYAGFIESNMRLYLDRIIPRKGVSLLHYEDLIADPESWMRSLLIGLGAQSEDLEELMPYLMNKFRGEFEIIDEENPANHRRQMKPGDHARKLKPATIEKLNKRFEFYFDALREEIARSS